MRRWGGLPTTGPAAPPSSPGRHRRVALVHAWGVEGQEPPAIEPPAAPSSTTPPRSVGMLEENKATVHEDNKATVHAGHGEQQPRRPRRARAA
jgi:hypothetical protein